MPLVPDGINSSAVVSSVVAVDACVTSTSGVWPETVTVSASAPIFID
jgi:hypothetical protein